jgi:two-component system sensor histidine kinase RegB
MNPAALRELETTLYWLRWLAVAGQAISLWLAWHYLGLALDWPWLIAGVATLAAGNAAITLWRRWQAPSEFRLLLALALDLAALSWALFHSGGVMNPFTMLYLLPVALTATVLPVSRVIALALAGCAGYGLLTLWAPPLPHLHGQGALDLHLTGMGVNFVLSMALLATFGLRLASILRRREQELQAVRERALRDEGLHVLALHAASAAHAINTPLATMRLLLDELRSENQHNPALRRDLELLDQQVGQSRQALEQLLAAATDQEQAIQSLGAAMALLIDRARLLRPAIELSVDLPATLQSRPLQLPRTLMATLGNLLDNAADAGLANDRPQIHFAARDLGERLCLTVCDSGQWPTRAEPVPGRSDKPGGLGWGLAIANATVEQLGGNLSRRQTGGGGTESRIELPWSALQPPSEADH